jgi:hypothetical protein
MANGVCEREPSRVIPDDLREAITKINSPDSAR